jgi:hypothetical protein
MKAAHASFYTLPVEVRISQFAVIGLWTLSSFIFFN